VFAEDVRYTDPLADVAVTDGDGRIRTVLGSLDRVPAAT
jgi:hypothetical protein